MNEAPAHPKLRKEFHKAIKAGAQIRYASDDKLVVWYPPKKLGCLWWMLLIICIIITLGLALLFAGVTAILRRGQVVTWEVKRNGKVKKTTKRSK